MTISASIETGEKFENMVHVNPTSPKLGQIRPAETDIIVFVNWVIAHTRGSLHSSIADFNVAKAPHKLPVHDHPSSSMSGTFCTEFHSNSRDSVSGFHIFAHLQKLYVYPFSSSLHDRD